MSVARNLLALCWLVIIAVPGISLAKDSFRTEIEAGYSYDRNDMGAEMDTYQLGARYHFMPVTTTGRPLAEAAFMARAGYIGGFWDESDIEVGSLDADVSTYGADLLWRKPSIPYAFHLIYNGQDQDVSTNQSANLDEIGLGVGYFFADNLYLEFAYLYEEIEASGSYTGETDQYQLSGKYVGALSNNRFYNIEVNLGHFEFKDKTPTSSWRGNNSVISVAGDYYLNERLSMGLGFSNESGDAIALEGKEYTVRVKYFVIPQLSVAAEYNRFDPRNSNIRGDEEGISLVMIGRF